MAMAEHSSGSCVEAIRQLRRDLEGSLGARLDRIEGTLLELQKHMAPNVPNNGAVSLPMAAVATTEVAANVSELGPSFTVEGPPGGEWSERTNGPLVKRRPEDAITVEVEGHWARPRGNAFTSVVDPACTTFTIRKSWERVSTHESFNGSDSVTHSPSGKGTPASASALLRHTRTLEMMERKEEAEIVVRHPWYILRPSSKKRLAWDSIGMMLILYDMLAIPFEISFQPPRSETAQGLFFAALIFWSLDVFMSFITGYYSRLVEVLELRRIGLYYMRTWMVLDLTVVGIDWFGVYNQSTTREVGIARMGKTLRILRVLRTVRLLRLVKLQRIMESLVDRIDSMFIHVLLDIWKLILVLLGINHIIACAWHLIGVTTKEEGALRSWIDVNHFNEIDNIAYKYLTSLHWSLTQFTPASMEVFPTNEYERGFAVSVLVLAMLVFSSFVSSITASMTQLRQMSSVFDKNMGLLRRFLRSREVPSSLSFRIIRYAEHKLKAQNKRVQEADVKLLRMLSKPLQIELLSFTFGRTMSCHLFFRLYADVSQGAIRGVCLNAAAINALCHDDPVFHLGHEDNKMFFLRRGGLSYRMFMQEETAEELHEEGTHCCEASMWAHWKHVGSMLAIETTEVITVDAKSFAEVTLQHATVKSISVAYAHSFVQQLNMLSNGIVVNDINQGMGEMPDLETLGISLEPLSP